MAHVMTVDEHPQVQRQAQKRAELTANLRSAEAQHARLLEERNRVAAEQREAQISHHLGDRARPSADILAQLNRIDAELAQAALHVSTLKEAADRAATTARGVREQVLAELREQAHRAAQDMIANQRQLFEQLLPLQSELHRLHAAGLVHLSPAFFQVFAFIPHWLNAASEFSNQTVPA